MKLLFVWIAHCIMEQKTPTRKTTQKSNQKVPTPEKNNRKKQRQKKTSQKVGGKSKFFTLFVKYRKFLVVLLRMSFIHSEALCEYDNIILDY